MRKRRKYCKSYFRQSMSKILARHLLKQITGAVQFGQGMNVYEDARIVEQPILSPFRTASKTEEEKKNSTIGTKICCEEAHYFYPFVINPLAYRGYEELGATTGYSEEDYTLFKQTALTAATAYSTNAKEGCENEFGLFVETDKTLYLPNLTEYIKFEKEEDKNKINLSECEKILRDVMDKIQKIEIYYNPATTKLEGIPEQSQLFHIVTGKEVV